MRWSGARTDRGGVGGARRAGGLRAARWELGLCLVGALLVLAPSIAPMRWSYRFLPLLHLGVALAAGRALDELGSDVTDGDTSRRRLLLRNPGAWAAVLTVVVALTALVAGAVDVTTAIPLVAGWLALFGLLALAWARAPVPSSLARWLTPALTAVAQVMVMAVLDHRDVPTWQVDSRALEPAPLHADRLYLGFFARATQGTATQSTRDPAPREPADALRPVVRQRVQRHEAFGRAGAHGRLRGRSRPRPWGAIGWSLEVSGSAAAPSDLVVTRRAWYPGWEATLDGAPVPVEAYEGVVAAARLSAGAHGRLVMRYRPSGLREGALVAAAALLLLVVLAGVERRRTAPE